MSGKSKIEWTGVTWNPVVGCTAISPGCANCYAARLASSGRMQRLPNYQGLAKDARWTSVVRCLPDKLDEPRHWRTPRIVFVNSMSDLFHEAVPREFIAQMFRTIDRTPQHTYQILTKRPERIAAMLPRQEELEPGLPQRVQGIVPTWRNVWLGTSCENQDTFDRRWPHLKRCPAAVRWISFEPLLGPVAGDFRGLDWAVIGGESGPGARPCDLDNVRSLLRDLQSAGVQTFVKQIGSRPMEVPPPPPGRRYALGERPGTKFRRVTRDPKGGDIAEWPDDLRVREWPKGFTPP